VRPGESRNAGGECRLVASRRDFAVTLLDGRRVVSRHHGDGGGEWSVYVYSPAPDAPILGYGTASTLPGAFQRAGLSGDDAGEALGRAGA
jgi:hypothetical protein